MSGNQIKKRERGANYTPEEKTMLTDLITQYKYVIEDKRTGGHIINKKKEAWKTITTKYNSNCTTGPRQTDQLKALYDNMKQKLRKNVGENNKLEYMNTLMQNAEDNVFVTNDDMKQKLRKNVAENNKLEYMNPLMKNAEDNVFVTNDDLATALKHVKQDKVEIQKTGGGSWKPTVTDNDAKILAIFQDQIEPLPNPYDSGAVYFKDQQQNTESQGEIMELDPEPPAIEITSVKEKEIVTDTLQCPVEVDYGDYYVSSPPDLQDANPILETTPSRVVRVTPARRKLPKIKVVQKKIKKPSSAEALKRIYFKKKCENACLERKKLMQEIVFNKEEHKLKMTILKNKLNMSKK